MKCLWRDLLYSAQSSRSLCVNLSKIYITESVDRFFAWSLNSQPPGLTPQLLASETDYPQQNLELSLTVCATSAWSFMALRQPLHLGYWITLCLSLLMILRLRKPLSLWMLCLPLNCKKSPRLKFPPENFSLQKFDLLISRCVFQMTLKPLIISFCWTTNNLD